MKLLWHLQLPCDCHPDEQVHVDAPMHVVQYMAVVCVCMWQKRQDRRHKNLAGNGLQTRVA